MGQDILNKIKLMGLIPVVVIDDVDKAIPSAEALIKGGLNVIEVTMRTAEGLGSIKRIKQAFPEMLVGAGTVLSVEKAISSVEAGAEFIVSPGFDEKIIEWCLNKNIQVIPGCVTPTEISRVLNYGIDVIKFFPASIYGGMDAIKALAGPFNMVSFIPTGGVNLSNLSEYANKSFIHAIGGGWLCEKESIRKGEFEKITEIVKDSIQAMLGFQIAHIGINTANEKEAETIAHEFEQAFGFNFKSGNSSNFAGTGIEVIKGHGIGDRGHIAIKTNNIDRACYYLSKKGFRVNSDTAKKKNEIIEAIYLQDEIGFFGIHLLKN